MNAQEFRIGNLVSRLDLGDHSLRVESVLELRKDKVLTTGPISVICLYSEIKPIPLTEEWLLKLGFENKHTNIFTKQIIISECTAQEKLKLEGWAGNISLIVENQFASNGCKHVHELQNLFFSLCGKELEIV